MNQKHFSIASVLAALLATVGVCAAEPKPVLDYDFSKATNGIVRDLAGSKLDLKIGSGATIQDGALVLTPSADSFAAADEAAFRVWSKGLRKNELSGCFWIRFDKGFLSGGRNSDTASLGLLDCYLNGDDAICVRFFTEKTSLMKPVVLTSKFKAEYNKWYHVEFFYSMNERRVKLYVDGKFQMENDKLILPKPDLGMLKMGNGFRGAIKDVKLYDAALESEELAISDATAQDYDVLTAMADDLIANAKITALSDWAYSLRVRTLICKANVGKVTIAAYKRLSHEIANAMEIAKGLQGSPDKTVSRQPFTTYVTPSTTQEVYLPDNLPQNGKLSNEINIIMAQDDFETASVIVVPFKPLQSFTLKMGDLVNGNNVLKGSDVDIKIVKRWFQTGGAWMTYHVDLYHRLLTPDLLVNDEKLITYDEFRRTNQMLMHYPGGDKYQEVSDFAYQNEWLDGHKCQFFYDAPTLQPVTFKEAGRNIQYFITIHAPKGTAPGFYDGKLDLIANGKTAGVMKVTVRVLPFELPRPRTYCDSDKIYLSHVNSYNGVPSTLKNAMDHNMFHLNGIAETPDNIALCKKLGYPLDIFFEHGRRFDYPSFAGPKDKMTLEDKARMDKMAVAPALEFEKMFEKYSGLKDYTYYRCWTSESSWYGSISLGADQPSTVLHTYTHMKIFSHGMTPDIPYFSPGIYDMDSATTVTPDYSNIWHAIGGRTINYAAPFPGPENPGLMRRSMGLELYKANHYDGHMMHGYVERQYNAFTKYPGGDGDYRSFDMALCQKDGCINSISIIGYREGFDDVRYASLMKMQAEDVLKNSKDELVIREAKRQLAWLERVNGDTMDMDDFRANVQYRIMALSELINQRQGRGN